MPFLGVLKVMTILAVGILLNAQLNVANCEITRNKVGEFLAFMGALGMVKMMSRSSHLDCIP